MLDNFFFYNNLTLFFDKKLKRKICTVFVLAWRLCVKKQRFFFLILINQIIQGGYFMKITKFCFVIAIILSLTYFTFGQETTGNIEGTVTDQAGARVPNVTVTLESQSFKRTVTTNEEGFFRALQLQPGIYTVKAEAANFQPFLRENVQVVLGRTTPVNIQLLVLGVGAEVTVTGANELPIDPTSSRIQTNLTEQELEQLPKGTNFTSALRAVPSVRPEPSAAGFAIDGATGVENTFIIDGQEVTNFRTGGLNTNNNLPFQVVRELQVKNSGFEAEFGGATGGVINLVTKGGGNAFHGELGAEFSPNRLEARPRPILRSDPENLVYITPKNDEGLGFYPFATLSGPIIKDRLWFFASAAPQIITNQRNFTFTDGSSASYRRRDQYDYYFARLDAAITNNLRVFSTFTYNPLKINGLLPDYTTLTAVNSANAAPDPFEQSQLGGRQPANNFNINGTWVATPNVVLNASWSRGYLNEKLSNYGIPQETLFRCITSGTEYGYNCGSGFRNITTNFATQKDISIRKNLDLSGSVLVDNFLGRHQFKAGYQRFDVFNDVASGYVGGLLYLYFGRTTSSADGEVFGDRPGEVGFARYIEFGEFGKASSANQAFYVQDSWQPVSNLTLNLGVRFEQEDVPSFTDGFQGITFGWGDKIAPRLGFAWDVFGNAKVKVFGNYGLFYDRFKYELPRGSFGGNIYNDYRAPIPASGSNIFNITPQYVLDNSLIYTNFRIPSNDPSDFRVDPNLKPVRQTEYTFGTQVDLGADTILGARYTHKQIDETIEDIGYHEGNSEAYFIGNPGSGICAQPACGRYDIPGASVLKPIRDYDALEIVIDKRFSSNATINASYTLSRLYGNYSGLASTDEYLVNLSARDSPNVNRFFDTPYTGFTVGGAPDTGLLPTDRPHVFKFFGAYTFNDSEDSIFRLPSSNELTISAFTTAQSGTPRTTRVSIGHVAYIPLFGRGDLGRTEMYTQTDAALAYRYRFGRDNRFGLQFNIDVLNLFNESNVLGRYELITDKDFTPGDFGLTNYVDLDRAFFNGTITRDRILSLINTAGNSINYDARYDQPVFFQSPRTIRFGFRFLF